MQSRKFPTLEDALSYMKERGKVTYWGREGTDAKTYVYTLTIGVKVYDILLHEDGLLRVTGTRYL
jgi:hypothetical protein